MNKEKEPIDYFGNIYDLGQKIEVDGNGVLLIAKFLTEIIEKETNFFVGFTFPEKVREIKDVDGNLKQVAFDWKEHTKDSFLATAASDDGGQLGLTQIGIKASQILSALLWTHEQNILAGKAKKRETVDEQRAFEPQ